MDSFLHKLGIRAPIIQAPMAGVSTPELAAAGITASLALGAVATQFGTAFVACPESSANPGSHGALLGPTAIPM